MNGRKGPFDFKVNFTTIIIVTSRMDAKIVRVEVLCIKYIVFIKVLELNIGKVIFFIKISWYIGKIRELIVRIMYSGGSVWLGVTATKYEKRTSMPLI